MQFHTPHIIPNISTFPSPPSHSLFDTLQPGFYSHVSTHTDLATLVVTFMLLNPLDVFLLLDPMAAVNTFALSSVLNTVFYATVTPHLQMSPCVSVPSPSSLMGSCSFACL